MSGRKNSRRNGSWKEKDRTNERRKEIDKKLKKFR